MRILTLLPTNNLNRLSIETSTSISLTGLENIEKINSLALGGFDMNTVGDLSGLRNVQELGFCSISNSENLFSIDQILPEINHIHGNLLLFNNMELEQIGRIDWTEPPQEFTDYFDKRLYLENNPSLNMCENYFICKALEAYPDSVFIELNGPPCDKEYLLENCDAILYTEEIKASDISIFPNPSIDQVTITSEADIEHTIWMDSTGSVVNVTTAEQNIYNISHLDKGIYFIKILIEEKQILKRFVKW